MNASAHNAAILGMDFIDRYVEPLASTIERLMLEADSDVVNLCQILLAQAEQYHNQFDCMRADAESEVSS